MLSPHMRKMSKWRIPFGFYGSIAGLLSYRGPRVMPLLVIAHMNSFSPVSRCRGIATAHFPIKAK
jgi:hypothetical protein